MKKNGCTALLRGLGKGESVVRRKDEVSHPKNMHVISARLGITVRLESIAGDLVKITRTK